MKNEEYIRSLADKTFSKMITAQLDISDNHKHSKFEINKQITNLQNQFSDTELLELYQFRVKSLQEDDTEEGFVKKKKEVLYGIKPEEFDNESYSELDEKKR